MSLAIVDAREWQTLMDLETGKKVQDESPQTKAVREILAKHPYPGDVDIQSNRWVTDTALDLINAYQPQLACLFYSHQFFAGRYTQMTEDQRNKMIEDVFNEVQRFAETSGYTPVIVGSGDMVELEGEIDLSKVDGIAISSHWSARYAGLHKASQRDLDFARSNPAIERVVKRDEWISLFPETEYQPERIPEHLLLAREGWTFVTTGTPLRKAYRVPGSGFVIPLSTSLGEAKSLIDIRALIDANLSHTRIALIIIEGVGVGDFLTANKPCINSVDWFYYEPGDAQYLTLTTGKHQVFAYPSGYQYHDENDAKKGWPFSGYFLKVPEHTLGMDFSGKSIAVGNHSMFVHMIFGADICIECFARNLYNQGCLGVIHRFK
jgi:hypothetical protein